MGWLGTSTILGTREMLVEVVAEAATGGGVGVATGGEGDTDAGFILSKFETTGVTDGHIVDALEGDAYLRRRYFNTG